MQKTPTGGPYSIPACKAIGSVASLSMAQLEHEVHAKVVIVTSSQPYLDNRRTLLALRGWSVPTCCLTLAIGLTRHSETMPNYDIMKGALVKKNETLCNMQTCVL
jgi:hypothetical protein